MFDDCDGPDTAAMVVLMVRMVAAVISAFQEGGWRQRKVNLPVVL